MMATGQCIVTDLQRTPSDIMGDPDERPAKAAEGPARHSSKGIFILIAVPISLILIWISLVSLLPLFLK